MGVGYLVPDNATATLSLRKGGRDAAGGTTETWEVVATVSGVCSGIGTDYVEVNGQMRPATAGTFTFLPVAGVTAASVIRLVWVTNAVPGLVGLTGQSVTITPHAASPSGLVKARLTCRWRLVKA